MSKQQGSSDFSQKGSMQSTIDQVHLTPSSYSLHYHQKEFCIHHPDKKAKYVLTMDPTKQMKVCSRCAVKYAFEKNPVQEIESQQDDKQRQTNSFLEQLSDTKNQIQTFIDKLSGKESILKDFYEKQYQKVVGFYFHIESKIQQTKQTILQQLSEFQWKSLDQINSNLIQCKQMVQTINQFLKDIQSNYEKIVRNPDTLPFNQIMGGYSSKLHKLQKFFTHIQGDKIEFIDFKGVNDKVLLELENQLHNLTRQPSSPLSEKKTAENRSHSEDSNPHLQTEPFANTLSPDTLNTKSSKRVKQSNSKIITSLLLGLSHYQQRQSKPNPLNLYQNLQSTGRGPTKPMSKTPEIAKAKQTSYPILAKNSPKFLFKNYYK